MKNFGLGVLAFIVFLAFDFIQALVTGAIVMLLWNWLMPAIFGLGTITYLQGAGISLLCAILFKSNNSSKSDK